MGMSQERYEALKQLGEDKGAEYAIKVFNSAYPDRQEGIDSALQDMGPERTWAAMMEKYMPTATAPAKTPPQEEITTAPPQDAGQAIQAAPRPQTATEAPAATPAAATTQVAEEPATQAVQPYRPVRIGVKKLDDGVQIPIYDKPLKNNPRGSDPDVWTYINEIYGGMSDTVEGKGLGSMILRQTFGADPRSPINVPTSYMNERDVASLRVMTELLGGKITYVQETGREGGMYIHAPTESELRRKDWYDYQLRYKDGKRVEKKPAFEHWRMLADVQFSRLEWAGKKIGQPIVGGINVGIYRFGQHTPSVKDITKLADEPTAENLKKLNNYAIDGIMPPDMDDKLMSKLGTIIFRATQEVKTKQTPGQRMTRSQKFGAYLTAPEATRVATGTKFESLPTRYKRRHPTLFIVPRTIDWTVNELFAEPYIIHPENAPFELAFDLVGAVVIGKGIKLAGKGLKKIGGAAIERAAKEGSGKLSKIAAIDITPPLRRAFGGNVVTLEREAWERVIDDGVSSNVIPEEYQTVFNGITDDELGQVGRALQESADNTGIITLEIPGYVRRKVGRKTVTEVATPAEDLARALTNVPEWRISRDPVADIAAQQIGGVPVPDLPTPDLPVGRIAGISDETASSLRRMGWTNDAIEEQFPVLYRSADAPAPIPGVGDDAADALRGMGWTDDMINADFPDVYKSRGVLSETQHTYNVSPSGDLVSAGSIVDQAGRVKKIVDVEKTVAIEASSIAAGPIPQTAISGGLISPSVANTIIGTVDRQTLGAALDSVSVLAPEDQATTIGKALGKTKEMAEAVDEFGADAVMAEISRVADAPAARTRFELYRQQLHTEAAVMDIRFGQRGAAEVGRRAPAPDITDVEVAAALDLGIDYKPPKSIVEWLRKVRNGIKDVMFADYEPNLIRAGHVQFADDMRTGLLPMNHRAVSDMELDWRAIVGRTITSRRGLSKPERESLMKLIALEDIAEGINRGETVIGNLQDAMTTLPDGATTHKAIKELADFRARLGKSHPAVIEAAEAWKKYVEEVGLDMVERGKLQPEDIRPGYFPHAVLEYQFEWFDKAPFAKKSAHEPYRFYTKQRAGSPKPYAISEQALKAHFATIKIDNYMDDWAKMVLEKNNVLPGMTPAQRREIFNGQLYPKQRRTYKIGDQTYTGFRYKNGIPVYRTTGADLKKLAIGMEDFMLEDPSVVNNLMSLPDDELLHDRLLGYLESVGKNDTPAYRQILAVGQYRDTYLLPTDIARRLEKFGNQAPGFEDWYVISKAMRLYKSLTLGPFGAGIPFHVNNFLGDAQNAFRTAGGSVNPLKPHMRNSVRMLHHINTPEGLPQILQRNLTIGHDKAVLDSGMLLEFSRVRHGNWRDYNPLAMINDASMKFSGFREGWLRMAMLDYQLDRLDRGLPLVGKEFKRFTDQLDPVSGAAFIARNFTGDYGAVPLWHKRAISGFAFPFATFYQKNLANWTRAFRYAPLRTTAVMGIPLAGAAAFNHKYAPELEASVPEFLRDRGHLWQLWSGRDTTGDGIKNEYICFGPQLPTDMYATALGIDKLIPKLSDIRFAKDRKKAILEAAKQQVVDTGLGGVLLGKELVNPWANVIYGIANNRNQYNKRTIVPRGMEGLSDWDKIPYYATFAASELIMPVGAYMRQAHEKGRIRGALPRSWNEVGEGLRDYLVKGPGGDPNGRTFIRGFGFYQVDVVNVRLQQMRDDLDLTRARGEDIRLRLKREYLRTLEILGKVAPTQITPEKTREIILDNFITNPYVAQTLEDAALFGINLNAVSLKDYLLTADVQREIAAHLSERAPTEENKKFWRGIYQGLKMRDLGKRAQSLPKALRPAAVKEMLDRENPPLERVEGE